METDSALPPVVRNVEMPDDDDDEQEEEGALAAPARLTLPPMLPPLPSGRPAAALIVETFESHVHVEGTGTFSPLRLWTLQARKNMGKDMTAQSTSFGRRAQIYLYILSRGGDPADMTEKESELRQLMVEWKQGLGKEAAKQINWEAGVKAADSRIAAAGLMNML